VHPTWIVGVWLLLPVPAPRRRESQWSLDELQGAGDDESKMHDIISDVHASWVELLSGSAAQRILQESQHLVLREELTPSPPCAGRDDE
jgi:hypothetical protein